jgi:hypothetical protein
MFINSTKKIYIISVKKTQTIRKYRISIIVIVLFGFFNGCSKTNESTITIEQQVAIDFVTEYKMVKKFGTPLEVCMAAANVVAAYLQAKDEPKYQDWQRIKNLDCQLAGLSKF